MLDSVRIVIVGGVAGGASAAARARRLSETASIMIVERGEHVSFANCGLPYHIGGDIPDRESLLVRTPQELYDRFRIDVRVRSEVLGIDRTKKCVLVRCLKTGAEYSEPYDYLILSPGAAPVSPPIPGATCAPVFVLRTLADMDAIKSVVDGGGMTRALVVGGGYIGLEMAEALCRRGVPVTLVELAAQVMGAVDQEMAEPLHRELRTHGVDVRLRTSVVEFKAGDDGRAQAHLSDGTVLGCDLVVLAIGVKPEADLACAAGLQTGTTGGIVVDATMRTDDPCIFAVGDAVEVRDFVTGNPALIPLAGPANRQGRVAADVIFGRDSAYRDTQGTAICRVFDIAIGMTGLSEKAAKRAGVAYEKVYVHPHSHASYYPGAQTVSLKLLFCPRTGKVLGAQAFGADGVDKRIDVLAVALRAGLTVFDLEHLELSYAPPYGSAKDAVNVAGFAAANVLRGDVALCHAADVAKATDDQMVLDVRDADELADAGIPGAVNVPLDELRDRLGELPRDRELLVTCQAGLRGYLACRILTQHGFRCRNLSGGYLTYAAAVAAGALDA